MAANAQGRGNSGVVREMPSGRPTGMDAPLSGRPGNLPSAANRGLATAMEASEGRLSRAQIVRAKEIERQRPASFETDRLGALAVRGEVIAFGIMPKDLEKIKNRGFQILRNVMTDGLDEPMYVLAKDGITAGQAIAKLQTLSPKAVFAYNHVYFESGAAANKASKPAPLPPIAKPFAVGLIDAGVATNLPIFSSVSITSKSFISSAMPTAHGTAVASILVGQAARKGNNSSVIKLHVGGVYGRDGTGGTAELLTRALGWMVQEKVAVINVSLVGPPNPVVAYVISQVTRKGHIIVAPVGNDGASARPLYPASYPDVVAVSAVDINGKLLPEASRGAKVDFVARGVTEVMGVNGNPTVVRGTSFAAPVVSRRLAQLLTAPDPIGAKVALGRLKSEAVRLTGISSGRKYGNGLIE